jgi:hypothetical protein
MALLDLLALLDLVLQLLRMLALPDLVPQLLRLLALLDLMALLDPDCLKDTPRVFRCPFRCHRHFDSCRLDIRIRKQARCCISVRRRRSWPEGPEW